MATFDTTIPLGYDTRLIPNAAKRLIRFDDNSYDIQDKSLLPIYNGKIFCILLTEAQKNTVMTFYDNNKSLTWQFINPQDGATYDLEFLDPVPTPHKSQEFQPARYIIVFTVVGTKQ